ncbi:ATP-binding protein [Mesorhizobium sp.]|uniref:sensor histidine kinase n=1 Tax=Mesorhizobium sp. TaxID=1871066 RepID=UPI000FE7360A|nr:ATP-binding protein [Mesorhizobium sp.]RWB55431.1 MAG: two-component sensor histidine kinase [Mesorhizobium sp.]
MKHRSFFSSIAFRLPFAILSICGLVASLALVAIYGLSRAESEMTSYSSTAFASLAKASTISRQVSALLSTAPFLLNTTSPYRLSNESLQIVRQIDALMEYVGRQPADILADLDEDDRTHRVLDVLSAIRKETLALADNADEAQRYKSLVGATVAKLEALQEEPRFVPTNNVALKQIAISAAASDNFLQLGELQRQYLKLSEPPGSTSPAVEAKGTLALYDGIFELRQAYLSRMFAVRSALTRLGTASQNLGAATEAQFMGTGQTLSKGFASTTQALSHLRQVILAALLLVIALSVVAILTVIRVSKAIMGISEGMHQLARGEKDALAPRFEGPETELRNLVRAFTAFKASVDRVARLRSTAEAAARTIRSTFRSMNEGIAIFDHSGRPITMNHRIIKLMQQNPSARKLPARSFASKIKEIAPDLLPDGLANPGNLRNPVVLRARCSAQSVLEVSLSRQAGERVVMLVRDITEADRQEADARRAQRLDAMMRMTHQVSHEVGNMIGIITGSLGLLEKAAPLDPTQQRHLARIRKAAERGKTLASSMLSAASQQVLAPARFDVGALLLGMLDVLEMAAGNHCVTRLDLRRPLPPVFVDPALFEQAVLNLCLNAAAAMQDGGEILIIAERRQAMLAVEVCDQGTGMAPEVMDRAFEPYFTTRPNRGGTGLGLAVVYGFVRQSGGEVSIHSRLGEGTRVEMLFPALPEHGGHEQSPELANEQ